MNKAEKLTTLQKQYMDMAAKDGDKERLHRSWFDYGTVDFWRHRRMYDTIGPLANDNQFSSWLTVDDGCFGLDAIRLKKLFQLSSVFPTDIGENMLKISKENGWVDSYGVENAEKLSFHDNSFDVVFCKEAFHHFPRPYLALYEMLRVCRKVVAMIEPSEPLVSDGVRSKPYLLSACRLLLAKILGRESRPYLPPLLRVKHSFEDAGNYLYTVSVREMEKLAHGMDLAAFAWKRFNDVYIKG